LGSPGVPNTPQTPETLRLQDRIISLEQELRQCQKERSRVQAASENFEFFSQNGQDFAFITFDPESRIVSWSRGAERLLGYSESGALGQHVSIIFTPEDRANGEPENELAKACRDGCSEDDRWHLRKDGTRFWGSGILTAHRDNNGGLRGYSKVMLDLSSRNTMEERLQESLQPFRLFSDNVRDYALVPVDTAGNISGWNPGAERTFGYTEREILGRPVNLFFTPEDRAKGESEEDLRRALAEGRAEDSRWMIRLDGSRFWARWVTTPMYDTAGKLRGFAKVLRDETERQQTEDLLKKSLQEKELLLREIHHRVKNNLQVISGLLSLQANQVNDSKLRVVLDELQDRVRAIGALHETLYGSRDLANIEFGPYMRQLVQDLVSFHETDRNRIQIRTEADDIALPIEQALPLGLIVNELVSNALKHAFPGDRNGVIDVQLRYLEGALEEGQAPERAWSELSVSDDGVGIGNAEQIWQRKLMGLSIVHLLNDQLHGRLALDQNRSTRFSVQFPLEQCEYARRRHDPVL
jgi:PAS domain S-box-containing protein